MVLIGLSHSKDGGGQGSFMEVEEGSFDNYSIIQIQYLDTLSDGLV